MGKACKNNHFFKWESDAMFGIKRRELRGGDTRVEGLHKNFVMGRDIQILL
jgi:hypothetical protein